MNKLPKNPENVLSTGLLMVNFWDEELQDFSSDAGLSMLPD